MASYAYQTDLGDILRGAGLQVAEVPGWRARGHHDGPFEPRALLIHHDASAAGDSPSAAQCWVDRAGGWHLVAAGRAQHAGAGIGWGMIPAELGNQYSLGVETDHTTGEAWPPAQLAALITGAAAICAARNWDPHRAIAGHKEYAKGRKTDPGGIDMNHFRDQVAAAATRGDDDVSYDDVVRALRDVLRLPANGLAVPHGQADNGALAAILVGMAQQEVNRDAAAAAQLRALLAAGDPDILAAAIVERMPPGAADVTAVAATLHQVLDTPA